MSASLLLFLCSKEEVCQKVDVTISGLPERGQGGLLTIGGDTVCAGDVTL